MGVSRRRQKNRLPSARRRAMERRQESARAGLRVFLEAAAQSENRVAIRLYPIRRRQRPGIQRRKSQRRFIGRRSSAGRSDVDRYITPSRLLFSRDHDFRSHLPAAPGCHRKIRHALDRAGKYRHQRTISPADLAPRKSNRAQRQPHFFSRQADPGKSHHVHGQ